MSRTGWKIAAGCGGLLALAPIAGLIGTMAGLAISFRSVSSPDVDPSMKAQNLAEGISLSMWATVVGLALFPLGAIVLGVSLWQIVRKPTGPAAP